ncbi:MAG: hypothetical protein MI976_23335 [Pseudomonadales bacterium]|nr:hypothetical protein [Pseudomonadales bacterium]
MTPPNNNKIQCTRLSQPWNKVTCAALLLLSTSALRAESNQFQSLTARIEHPANVSTARYSNELFSKKAPQSWCKGVSNKELFEALAKLENLTWQASHTSEVYTSHNHEHFRFAEKLLRGGSQIERHYIYGNRFHLRNLIDNRKGLSFVQIECRDRTQIAFHAIDNVLKGVININYTNNYTYNIYEFDDNYQAVYGELITPDSVQWQGNLKQGLPNGKGTITFADGHIAEATYDQGKLQSKNWVHLYQAPDFESAREKVSYGGAINFIADLQRVYPDAFRIKKAFEAVSVN